MQIETLISEEISRKNILLIKDTINQLTLLTPNLIEITAETSLTFCNLNKAHSSIITSKKTN